MTTTNPCDCSRHSLTRRAHDEGEAFLHPRLHCLHLHCCEAHLHQTLNRRPHQQASRRPNKVTNTRGGMHNRMLLDRAPWALQLCRQEGCSAPGSAAAGRLGRAPDLAGHRTPPPASGTPAAAPLLCRWPRPPPSASSCRPAAKLMLRQPQLHSRQPVVNHQQQTDCHWLQLCRKTCNRNHIHCQRACLR